MLRLLHYARRSCVGSELPRTHCFLQLVQFLNAEARWPSKLQDVGYLTSGPCLGVVVDLLNAHGSGGYLRKWGYRHFQSTQKLLDTVIEECYGIVCFLSFSITFSA